VGDVSASDGKWEKKKKNGKNETKMKRKNETKNKVKK
jgi:hypothetical protein